MMFLVQRIVSLFYDVVFCLCVLRDIFHTPILMAQYSLFVLKVPLNTNQLTK